MDFDTLFFPYIEDNKLILIANEEKRIILTRDRDLFYKDSTPGTYYLYPLMQTFGRKNATRRASPAFSVTLATSCTSL